MSPQSAALNGPAGLTDRYSVPATIGDRALFAVYHRNRFAEAREELVRRFSGLARRLAHRYRDHGEPLEDLQQVAHLGLVKAIDGFDPDRNREFNAYAIPTILGELRRHFRDHCWRTHVPRRLKDLRVRIPRATERLTQELGREPTDAELSQALEVPIEEIDESRKAGQAAAPASLDEPSGPDHDGTLLAEQLGSDDPRFLRSEVRMLLGERLKQLSHRDREVIRLRFEEDLTQSQIAERVGVSQMQISRILRSSLQELRKAA